MSRIAATALLILLWAATYLTFLGSSELRSEEPHRVLPAVQMLESGIYVVPYVGSRPYLNKPPLVNWIIAGSFKLFRRQNDWTARLPSPVFLLVASLLFLLFARRELGAMGSLIAALCWLTNLGLMEKGRMIEIEAIYVSFFACAFLLWLVWWQRQRSPWLTFTIPWLILGLGLLAKGPTHVIFFYVLFCAVLWRANRLRDLLHPAHFVGILLMLGILVAWLIPFFQLLHWKVAFATWSHDTASAFHGERGRNEDWALNFPRGSAYFLPWLLLAPFIRLSRIPDDRQRKIVAGLIYGSLAIFIVVLLIPGTLPRYVLPLAAPFCYVVGICVRDAAFEWRLRVRATQVRVNPSIVTTIIGAGVVAAMIIFPLRSVTFLKRHERLKPIAARVNAIIPANEPLYALDPPYQPYFFYLHPHLHYVSDLTQLPPGTRYLLISSAAEPKVEKAASAQHLPMRVVLRTPRSFSSQTTLLELK